MSRDNRIKLEFVDQSLQGADVCIWFGTEQGLWAIATDLQPLILVPTQFLRRKPTSSGVFELYEWISAWQSKQTGIALFIVSGPPSTA